MGSDKNDVIGCNVSQACAGSQRLEDTEQGCWSVMFCPMYMIIQKLDKISEGTYDSGTMLDLILAKKMNVN